jgi:hypothetical protein
MVISFSENVARLDQCIYSCSQVYTADADPVTASEERIRKTVEFLAQQDVDLIATGHCTGFKAQVELYLKFKERFTPLYTGMVFTF